MKLLFDENLSPRLPRLLAAIFPESVHVRDCGLKGSPDEELWSYAAANRFTLVSKDSDFYARSSIYGPPPKLIWLRIGNCTRDEVIDLLRRHVADIHAFEENRLESILAIS